MTGPFEVPDPLAQSSVGRFAIMGHIRYSSATRINVVRAAKFYPLSYIRLEIQIFDIQRVGLDKLAPRFYDIAHQFCEQIVSLGQIFDFDLQ